MTGSQEALIQALDKAIQLADIASDWNLDEVEIDGEMVSVLDLRQEFVAAMAEVGEHSPPRLRDKLVQALDKALEGAAVNALAELANDPELVSLLALFKLSETAALVVSYRHGVFKIDAYVVSKEDDPAWMLKRRR